MDNAFALSNGIEGPARWSLRLLGGFHLSPLSGSEKVVLSGKRERVLLAYLALSPSGRQPRRKLAALLWGDAGDETALDNLRTCVWSLRKALGDIGHHVIASEGEDIVLDAASLEVDALTFRRLAAQSDLTALKAAANLYSGEFLDGLDIESEEFESWRRAEAARHRDQCIDVLVRLMTQLAACGDIEGAIETGVRILSLEPLHEAAVRRLMRLYGESGRRGAAVQLYRTFADALRTELDAEPEAETRCAFAEITRNGEERTNGPAAADAKLPPPPTATARPSDAPNGPMRPPREMAFRRRASLAVLAAVLVVVTALLSYRRFSGTAAESHQTAVSAQTSTISIVVLPFANLSGDASQEFFSDGMTEEITSALVKVPNLRVVARTSAFQFKGKNQDVRMIARSLGASHLIEGSVRKVGNRVRISAELIEADNGTNLWTESYERDVTDIFAIQEDIAQAIASLLRAPLGFQESGRLVSSRSIDQESYEQYLRAKALVRARGLTNYADAVALLEQVVAREPSFGPAWAMLASAYNGSGGWDATLWSRPIAETRRLHQSLLTKAETAAREGVRLDPRHGGGYAVLGALEVSVHNNWSAAEDLYRQALALEPNDSQALGEYAEDVVARTGRLKEFLRLRQQAQRLEPLIPVYNIDLAIALQANGNTVAAIAILEALPANAVGGFRNEALARAYASVGRFGEAADTILAIPKDRYGDSGQSIQDAARLMRSAPTKVHAPEALPVLPGRLNFIYAYVGAPERMMEFPERALEAGLVSSVRFLFDPLNAPVRKTNRFKAFVRNAGMLDYWRGRGWPDLCRAVGHDDFVCD
jgi:adenylate cyclase